MLNEFFLPKVDKNLHPTLKRIDTIQMEMDRLTNQLSQIFTDELEPLMTKLSYNELGDLIRTMPDTCFLRVNMIRHWNLMKVYQQRRVMEITMRVGENASKPEFLAKLATKYPAAFDNR